MAQWWLLVQPQDGAERRIPIDGELLIGRGVEGDGRLAGDPQVSREHARITPSPEGEMLIEDLGSANGTILDGRVLTPFTPDALGPRSLIKIGTTALSVERSENAMSSAAPGYGLRDAASIEDPRRHALPAGLPHRRQAATPVEQAGSPSSVGSLRPGADRPPPAELLYPGHRASIPPQGLVIGRNIECDVVIESNTASREHARVLASEGRYFIADLGSRNGTELNGELLYQESRWLNSGDTIKVGGTAMRFVTGRPTKVSGGFEQPAEYARVVELKGDSLTIGRDPSNGVVLDDPNVSRFHAVLHRGADTVELSDLGSRNGTRLDHELISRQISVAAGSEIGIGPFRLVFDGTSLVRRDDRGVLRLRADDVSTVIDGHVILNRASMAIEPGEFIAIIGESGSGKTTLLRALAGVVPPSKGRVTVNGESVLTRLTDIGYVPQDEIVHPQLTVAEALYYAAALRLPSDSSKGDIRKAVSGVLGELSLEERAEFRIGSLSGGQRKRVTVASELLNRPSLLFLDEPTTGLDPGLETRLMQVFCDLAETGKRAIALVTHATKNLDLADRVCVMGQGGELAFLGPPADAREFFGVSTYDGIYTALDQRPAVEWRREFEDAQAQLVPTHEADVEPVAQTPAAPRPRRRPKVRRQGSLLSRRYLRLMVRDRRNLALLLGQVPLLALGIALLFKVDVFTTGPTAAPGQAVLLSFLMITTAIWIGSIDASREIVKERAVFERERAVGVRLGAYLGSKAAVLFALVVIQCVVLVSIVFAMRPLHESDGTYLLVLLVLTVTGFVAVTMGLLISSLVSTEDQAASVIPLVLIPQLLFGGAILAVHEMSAPIKALSAFVFSRWSLAALGSVIHMNGRLTEPEGTQTALDLERFGTSFFGTELWQSLAILCVFLMSFLAATAARLNAAGGAT
jgi:ABC-type multidrug transport system ATPase subunit